jgi:hypothetical protein
MIVYVERTSERVCVYAMLYIMFSCDKASIFIYFLFIYKKWVNCLKTIETFNFQYISIEVLILHKRIYSIYTLFSIKYFLLCPVKKVFSTLYDIFKKLFSPSFIHSFFFFIYVHPATNNFI